MSMTRSVRNASPCYCPSCQRIFRSAPSAYVCPVDQTPVIDIGDPIPKSFVQAAVPVGLVLTLVVALGVSIQLV